MNRSGDLLLFHIRAIRGAGGLALLFRTKLEMGVGRSLPCPPFTEALWQSYSHPCDQHGLEHRSRDNHRGYPHSSECRSCPSHREVHSSLLGTHRPWNLLRTDCDPFGLTLPITHRLVGTDGRSAGKRAPAFAARKLAQWMDSAG